MNKKRIILISAIALFLILFLFVLCLGILARQPCYQAKYFTQHYLEKYFSPEETFKHFCKANAASDPEYYREVLGRKLTRREVNIKPSEWKTPKLIEISKGKKSAYILAENWGGSFERLDGRWVFQNREIGFYCRQFFRVFSMELARFGR
jgi:hypothetical protein